MWGVCLDINAPDLFQTVIQYDKDTAALISPENERILDFEKIKPLFAPPEFNYGTSVSPAAHPEITGRISRIFWHFEQGRYYYKIEINGKLQSKRYFAEELTEV